MNPNDPMFTNMVQSVLTKLLTIAGALLVQRGLVNANDMNELAVGLGMLVTSVAVSWYRAKLQNKTIATAIKAPSHLTVTQVKDLVRDVER